MADQIVAITGIPEVLRGLKELNKFMKSPKPMDLLTKDVRKRILDLTAKSLDYRGRRFAKYSDKYAEYKKKKTGSSKVNLRLSGAMMDAIETEVVSPKKGRVFVGVHNYGRITSEWLAQIHSQGTGPQKQREFMNVTKNALRVFIKKRYDDPILNIIKHYLRTRRAGAG